MSAASMCRNCRTSQRVPSKKTCASQVTDDPLGAFPQVRSEHREQLANVLTPPNVSAIASSREPSELDMVQKKSLEGSDASGELLLRRLQHIDGLSERLSRFLQMPCVVGIANLCGKGKPSKHTAPLYGALRSTPVLVRNVPSVALAQIVSKLLPALGLKRLALLLDGSHPEVLAEVLRVLPPDQTQTLIAVVQHANLEAVLQFVNGGVDPSFLGECLQLVPADTLLHLLAAVPVPKLVDLFKRLPPCVLMPLLTEGPPTSLAPILVHVEIDTVEIVLSSVNPTVIVWLLLGVDAERAVGLLLNVEATINVTLLKDVPTSTLINVIAGVPASKLIPLLQNVPTLQVVELLISLKTDDFVKIVNHVDPDVLENIGGSVASTKLIPLLQNVPTRQVVKLSKSLKTDDLVTLLNDVDPAVLANIAGSVSASLLKQVLKVVPAKRASKLIAVAPRRVTKLLRSIKPASSTLKTSKRRFFTAAKRQEN